MWRNTICEAHQPPHPFPLHVVSCPSVNGTSDLPFSCPCCLSPPPTSEDMDMQGAGRYMRAALAGQRGRVEDMRRAGRCIRAMNEGRRVRAGHLPCSLTRKAGLECIGMYTRPWRIRGRMRKDALPWPYIRNVLYGPSQKYEYIYGHRHPNQPRESKFLSA